MTYTPDEQTVLTEVNTVGLQLEKQPEMGDIVFVLLHPYLDRLMALLKRLNSDSMAQLFIEYPGVKIVMAHIEEGAQAMEQALGLQR